MWIQRCYLVLKQASRFVLQKQDRPEEEDASNLISSSTMKGLICVYGVAKLWQRGFVVVPPRVINYLAFIVRPSVSNHLGVVWQPMISITINNTRINNTTLLVLIVRGLSPLSRQWGSIISSAKAYQISFFGIISPIRSFFLKRPLSVEQLLVADDDGLWRRIFQTISSEIYIQNLQFASFLFSGVVGAAMLVACDYVGALFVIQLPYILYQQL